MTKHQKEAISLHGYRCSNHIRLCLLGMLAFFGSAEWSFAGENHTAPQELVNKLCDVRSASIAVYRAHDDQGMPLHCLHVLQVRDGRCFGVYHAMKDGVFALYLGVTVDGIRWRQLRVLDSHASQGQLFETPTGQLLLAYEADAPNSCWIRLKRFASVQHLLEDRVDAKIDLARSLAPTAEGTPSLISVETREDDEVINLRFHFYQSALVDRLARGTLKNFTTWKARPDEALNDQFSALGESGNFGSRDTFAWQDKQFCLQEIQRTRSDWASWGVYLCGGDGAPLQRLSIQTHGGSTAFCNPHIGSLRLADGKRVLLVTLFLPHEGAAADEDGELIYLIPLSSRS